MAKNKLAAIDSIMRLTHTYTGLFLIPWLLVYAGSAFCLNHGPWITKTFKIDPPKWEMLREEKFVPDANFPKVPAEQGRVIMQHLDIRGAHRVLPNSGPKRMTILRPSGAGNTRIIWLPPTGRLTVERQPFSAYRLMHFLHFKGSYKQKSFVHIAWAVIVDIVAISMVVWIISGVYIWFRRRRQRLSGGICLAGGILLFSFLVVLLCL